MKKKAAKWIKNYESDSLGEDFVTTAEEIFVMNELNKAAAFPFRL